MAVRDFFRGLTARQYVRPWALAAPILVLILTLPLLRPLRHPMELSLQEATRVAAVQSLVEQHRLVPLAANLPPSHIGMPVFTLLLAIPYWIIHHLGYRLSSDTEMVNYLLTLICATIPAAATPGLIYRMGRIFELSRPKRFGLSLGVVLCSGLISYATVLNPGAAAAFLVLASAACLVHVAVASRPTRTGPAIAFAGLFAATAAAIDLYAIPFLILLPIALLFLKWSKTWRIGAVLFFCFGATPPILLHVVLSAAMPNRPASLGDAAIAALDTPPPIEPAPVTPSEDYDEIENQQSAFSTFGNGVSRLLQALFGSHGLLSHFPVFILAGCGIAAVIHRHWPRVIKCLAVLSLCGAIIVICFIASRAPSWPMAMYATRFFIPFSPFLLFWAGAWLRRNHGPVVWSIAVVLIAFSAIVGLIGSINPFPPAGYNSYTPVAAVLDLVHPKSAMR